jgi:hypothetical protein
MDLREQEGSLNEDMEAMYDLLAWLTESESDSVDHDEVRHV